MIGTGTELVLIGHDEDGWQWIPLVLLGIAILASVGMLATGNRKATGMTRWFRAAMRTPGEFSRGTAGFFPVAEGIAAM